MPESPLPETSAGTSLLMPDTTNRTKPFHAHFTRHRHSHSIARQTFSLCTRITLKRSVVFCLRFACHPLLAIRWLSFLSIYANHLSLGRPHDDLLRKSVGTFLVHRASSRIRLHLLMDHFRIARQMFSLSDLRQLWKGGTVDMGVIHGRHERYRIALRLADHCGGRHEGVFAIQLARERDGFALWTASFIFAGSDEFSGSVIIGGMQGPKGETAKQSLITATRCLAGLRPKDAVLLVLQGMAAKSEASHLMAVSNARHAINQRRRKRRRMMLANLDAYWIDRGGQPCEPFGFSLPATAVFPAEETSKREKCKRTFWEAGRRLIKGHGA
ncbi:hypothetical protein EV217_3602 [Phyllobacterium myrsinacearum]|nr:hypothetical protein EV217_3602 [Phyllobacterium myrsinacearum]